MANEFIARKGLISLGDIQVSGSITTTGTVTISGSIASASYASNAELLDNLDATSFVYTSSFNSYSSSVSTRVSNLESTSSILTTASASFAVVSSSYSAASGSLSTRVTTIESKYATTGSNIFTGNQTVCANITATGTIVAQTLNVQQVTSSIVYSSGSNIFGCLSSDIQQMTGSLRITGSGNHWFQTGCVGIGTITPCQKLHVFGSSDATKARFELLGTAGVNEVVQIVNSANWNPGRGVKMGLYVNSGSNQSQLGAEIGAVTIAADSLGADLFFNVASASVATERMRITSAGNVGIGTASPCSLFETKCFLPYSCNGPIACSHPVVTFSQTDCANGNRGLQIGVPSGGITGPVFLKVNGTSARLAFLNQSNCENFTLNDSGIACFACQICAPTLSIPGCIINTTNGGIFLKHCVNDKNFWVWQENSAGWGQFTANCNAELSALGGLFAGSGLTTFLTNAGAGVGISLSSLTGAGSTTCGTIGLDHNNGNAYFAGNIGMGANLSTNWATRNVLQVGGFGTSLSGYNAGGGATQLMHNIIANGFTYTYMNTGGATSQYMDGSDIVWANAASGTGGASLTLIERMRITNCGNVGIGTNSPEGRLHIQGCTAGYGANLVLLNFCNAIGASTGIDFGVDQSSAGCANGNAQIKVCNIGGSGGSNCSDMIFSLWNGTAFCERLRIRDKGTILLDTGNNSGQSSTLSPVALRFNNDYSSGYTDASLKLYLFNSGATIQGFTAGPQYDLQYHSSGNADSRHSFYTENVIRLMVKSNAICVFQPILSACNYKAHTFCLFDATSIPGKTFTVSGNTQGCFSVTDFTGIPTSARAVLVYGWYHINGDGLAGQADHAVSWFGVQNNTSLQTWSSPTAPWPGETTTFRCCNFGTFVMEHDGDASAVNMTNGMHYYGSWHNGIIGVDSGGCIKYNLAHGYSAGTHYNGLYAVGYWL